jgi:hypothetical protein
MTAVSARKGAGVALSSARFRGNLRLESIAAGNTQDYLRFNDQGEEVKAVQWALIDAGYDIPDGATGYFGAQTSSAVVDYKTDHSLFPNDPVVGIQTITKLDEYFVLPDADHDEYVSWKLRPLDDWNWHRRRELVRRATPAPFTFNPVSNFVPQLIKDNMASGLEQLLDPWGSPNGQRTPPATWGASPLDLFHVHLVVDSGGADPSWSDVRTEQQKLHNRQMALMQQADAAGPEGTPAWTAAYAALLLAPGTPGQKSFCEQAGDILTLAVATSATVNQPLKLVWHTFEIARWRPTGMTSSDQRRHWWQTVAPGGGAVTAAPFVTPQQFGQNVDHLIELGFVIHQLGAVTVMATTYVEAAAVAGLTKADINAAWNAP